MENVFLMGVILKMSKPAVYCLLWVSSGSVLGMLRRAKRHTGAIQNTQKSATASAKIRKIGPA
jgi:hypothetical protein